MRKAFVAPTLTVYGDVRSITAKASANRTIDSAAGVTPTSKS